MLNIIDDKTLNIQEGKQIIEFSTDGIGDYYFTLYSDGDLANRDYYSVSIDINNPIYSFLKCFIEQEISCFQNEEAMVLYETPYFVMNGDSITIANQNKPIAETETLKFLMEKDKIQLIFSQKFPSSIRINELGRKDHYPFYMPVIDLFNILQNINLAKVLKGTGCYKNIKSGNTVSITGDGGNAWGYFGPAYKKLAPSLSLYEYWRDNSDGLAEEELIDYYVQEYFKHRLVDLNALELLETLKERFGEGIILLCHEMPSILLSYDTFCHRRIVADFINIKTGIVIPEIDDNGVVISQFDYRPKLRELIRKQTNL